MPLLSWACNDRTPSHAGFPDGLAPTRSFNASGQQTPAQLLQVLIERTTVLTTPGVSIRVQWGSHRLSCLQATQLHFHHNKLHFNELPRKGNICSRTPAAQCEATSS